jgi:N-acyl-D-amino-acid deacylase
VTRQPMGLLVKASSLLLIGAGVLHASQQTDFYDVIIRNGTVFDGTGAPGKRGDVGIRGGYIAAVGELTKRVARVEIDAAGLYICTRLHQCPRPFGNRCVADRAENMLLQGVTTSILNPDGGGSPDVTAQLADYASRPLATNVGASIGFNSVWKSVVGQSDRRASPEEIGRMQHLIVDNLHNVPGTFRQDWTTSPATSESTGH